MYPISSTSSISYEGINSAWYIFGEGPMYPHGKEGKRASFGTANSGEAWPDEGGWRRRPSSFSFRSMSGSGPRCVVSARVKDFLDYFLGGTQPQLRSGNAHTLKTASGQASVFRKGYVF